jgi:hypothetical protein
VNYVPVCSISRESIIDVEAEVVKVEEKIESCSQQDIELHVTQVPTGQTREKPIVRGPALIGVFVKFR